MANTIKKSAFFFALFLTVLIISETIYLYNNPGIRKVYTLKYAQLLAYGGFTKESLELILNTGIQKSIEDTGNKLTPPEIPDHIYQTLSNNPKLKSEIDQYITTADFDQILEGKSSDFSRLFYDIGLISLNNNEAGAYPLLLRASVYLRRDLAFWWIELANYYYRSNNPTDGLSTLSDCRRIDISTPVSDCFDYSNYITRKEEPLPLGFLSTVVSEFYNSQSKDIQ